jgi:hypothetical protein
MTTDKNGRANLPESISHFYLLLLFREILDAAQTVARNFGMANQSRSQILDSCTEPGNLRRRSSDLGNQDQRTPLHLSRFGFCAGLGTFKLLPPMSNPTHVDARTWRLLQP